MAGENMPEGGEQQYAACRKKAMPLTVQGLLDGVAADPAKKLLEGLASASAEERFGAAAVLRTQTSRSPEMREAILAAENGLDLLISGMHSPELEFMEHAVTIVHNIALSYGLYDRLTDGDKVIDGLIYVLKNGSDVAKSNAAAAIFNLSRHADRVVKIANFEGIYAPLVRLLKEAPLRGKKDAAYALFCLTSTPKGSVEGVNAGAAEVLLSLLAEGHEGLDEKVLAVISNLAKCPEGAAAIVKSGGFDVLGDVLECGSSRSLEDAVSTMFSICEENEDFFAQLISEGLIPSIISLSKSSKLSSRGQQKAKHLVDEWRSSCEARLDGLGLSNDFSGRSDASLPRLVTNQRPQTMDCDNATF